MAALFELLVFSCLFIAAFSTGIPDEVHTAGSAHEEHRKYFDTTLDVSLSATPRNMYPGFTKDLTLMCNFSTHLDSDFSSLQALILSKSDAGSDKYRELAIVTSLPTDHFENRESLGAEVIGGRTANNQSFIRYKWTWPDQDTGGKYVCEGHGLSNKGRPRMSIATVEVVTKDTLDKNALQQTLQDLETRLDKCSVHSERQTEEIDSLKNSLNHSNTLIKYLNSDVGVASWRGHTYFLSQSIMTSVPAAQKVCEQLGGYLLEIGSDEEFDFATNLIRQVDKDSDIVAVGSWDEGHEGRWTFIRSEKPMTTFRWGHGEPNNSHGGQNCVFIYYKTEKEMDDDYCNFGDLRSTTRRCICEIPEKNEQQ